MADEQDDTIDLNDLTPDPKNARKHTPRNIAMIADALKDVGAARSIVIDEDGVVLAGNATTQAAVRAGISRVRVVDATGDEIIAVRRTNLTPAQKSRLALFDNRAAELSGGWDTDVLRGLMDDGVSMDGLFRADELAFMMHPAMDITAPDFQPVGKAKLTITFPETARAEVRAALGKMSADIDGFSYYE